MIPLDMETEHAQLVKREQYLTGELERLTAQHTAYSQNTNRQLAMLTAEISRLHDVINRLCYSFSWKVTYPVRLVSKSIGRLLLAFRRTRHNQEEVEALEQHHNHEEVEALEQHHNQKEAVAPIEQQIEQQAVIEWHNYPVSVRLNYEYLQRMNIAS